MTKTSDVADLAAMGRSDLVALWQQLFDHPAPAMLSRSFLRLFIAFEMQSRRRGGLSRQAKATLEKGSEKKLRPALKPGACLLRGWNGVTHMVDVSGGGFACIGRPYRSLPAIAREITGAHWSGPRFFGLTDKGAK